MRSEPAGVTPTGVTPAARYARFLAVGELLLRLSPRPGELLATAHRLSIDVGGSEANVAAALAALGHGTALVSAVPDTALGDAALASARRLGVDCRGVVRRPGRMGLYWLEPGAGNRASEVIYDRQASSFARLSADSFDWPTVLRGADRLHLSGITVALGADPAAMVRAAAAAALAADVPVSFDGNFRARLWAERTGVDTGTLVALAGSADILFGDARDIALLLGGAPLPCDTPQARRAVAKAAFGAFPRLRLLAYTIRTTPHAGEHALVVRVDTPDAHHETASLRIPAVIDRIGSGDAFAAGILHGNRLGLPIDAVAQSGLALAALKHSVRGDAAALTGRHIDALLAGTTDVRR